MKQAIIIVAKQPQAGLVKTRLGAAIGATAAATLYRAFSDDTLRMVQTAFPNSQVVIAHYPPEAHAYFRAWAGDHALVFGQQGATFGERLQHAFATTARLGYDRMVLIGTDSPSLPASILAAIFEQLDDPTIDGVIGRCTDGGWYALGLRHAHAALFENIAWSSEIVYQQMLERAATAGLVLAAAPEWYDIDTVADLSRLRDDLAAADDAPLSATLAALHELEVLQA